MKLRDVLFPLDQLFRNHRIEYAVIGGYAVAAWGEPRATRDLDLLCSAKDENALAAALRDAGLNFEHRLGELDDPISGVIHVELGTAGNPYDIDVLFGIRGAPGGIFARVRLVQIEDLMIPVASPEDTIILKLIGGSARDIDDARSILRTHKDFVDHSLLVRLCPDGLKDLLQKTINANHR